MYVLHGQHAAAEIEGKGAMALLNYKPWLNIT